ncbi:hypothetical protein [Cellulomonas sp. PSBB021]|uniref:hypothetical protein n=1 Tax=Cellulomonas sp. PSBB021 TaxID=2003551 RepID=UPI000B8D673A|nr:hypothetical protein [Cellulomonas sp. PSBB021]ASR56046.1 hypothetical protein CBP52_14155 [Cellulomonas sp. PSBB021]
MPPTVCRTVVVLAVALVAAAAGGCADDESRGRDAARSTLETLLDRSGTEGDEIAEIAADVVEAARGTGVVMVGVEHEESAGGYGSPIGSVTLGITVPEVVVEQDWQQTRHEQDPGPYCFEVTFHRRGVLDTRGVDCPDGGLVAVPVPPARLPRVAVNAHDAVWSVLEEMPAQPPAPDRVVADVTARLEPHANGVTPLAEVTAAVQDGSVAVATGDGDECVLVARGPDGVVRDVHVPGVYLQPGELGCVAGTAFADLRPPH